MVPVRVHGLGLDQTTDQPVLLLKEIEGLRVLPIWIGQPEATAILISLEDITSPRPMTHDLLIAAIGAGGLSLVRVEITRLEDGTFYAVLVLEKEDAVLTVDARPSDSIALALRARCPMLVAESVLDAVGIVPDEEADQEIERFRDFLESVDPEDFASS
jgi:bifunctional DNase/RNase